MKYFMGFILTSALLLASDTINKGNLQWQDNAEAKTTTLNWQDAIAYCTEFSLAGHNDWRLPNIKELQSIVDINRYNPPIKKGFNYVATSDYYWSSSQVVSDAKNAWVVYFKYGHTLHYSTSNEGYVRCVRHGQ